MVSDEFKNKGQEMAAKEAVVSPGCGFQTAKGSIYIYDGEGKTTQRFKGSDGKGQGAWDERSMCLFLPEEAHNILARNYSCLPTVYRNTIGYSNGKTVNLVTTSLTDVPEGVKPNLYVIDRASGKIVMGFECQTEPALGFYPFEKAYSVDAETGEDVSNTHFGNKITKLYHTKVDLLADLRDLKGHLAAGTVLHANRQPE